MKCDSQRINTCPVCGDQADLAAMLWESGKRCLRCGYRPRFVLKTAGNATVVTFLPDLAYEDKSRCLDDLLGIVERRGLVVVNLSCMVLPSSFVLGMLIAVRHRAVSLEGSVRLCGLSDQALEVFHMTKLTRLFEIYPSEDAAITDSPEAQRN